jgi:hypothetical protein
MKGFRRHATAVALIAACCTSRADVPSGYRSLAQAEGVPAEILYAVACAESGREMPDGEIRPWPWALNVGGESRFYSSRAAAYRDLTSELPTQSSIDIGLGQINWYWHRHRLVSAWLALDPYFNLRTTAQLLRAQFDRCRCNDWWIAVERYHAPSDSASADRRRVRYRERVIRCSNTF